MSWVTTLLGRQPKLTLGSIEPHFPLWPAPQFKLKTEEQAYHAMICGQTGSGKSKTIVNAFLQRVARNQGNAIIEPHHDLSVECVNHLIAAGFYRKNPNAFADVVYIDWGNGAFIPWNILDKQGRGVDDETIGKTVLSAFLRVWPELDSAPNFRTLILSGVSVLLANGLPFTCFQYLIQNQPFRERCLSQVTNPAVHTFFAWYDRLRPADQAETIASTMKRIFELEYQNATRLTFGQGACAINLRQLMDEGRSIILNLGNIDDSDSKQFIGAILLKQIEQAAFSRRDIQPESRRRHFVTFVDEFQIFVGQDKSIQEMLSQARKFRLTLWLATQTLTNIDLEGMRASLENCRVKISFGLGHNSAVIQAREIGEVDPYAIKEEAKTETQHAQFLGIAEQLALWGEELKKLKPQYCYVKVGNNQPVKLKATTIPHPKVDEGEAAEVFAEYRRRYQQSFEAAVALSMGSDTLRKNAPVVAPSAQIPTSFVSTTNPYEHN